MDPSTIPVASHGGLSPQQASGGKVIDLSLSTNPYGPPPFLQEALRRGKREVASYPDREQQDLTREIAKERGLRPGEVLVAGSASELLRACITAFGQRRRVVLPQYTYEEYARIAVGVGARVDRVPMPHYVLSPESLASRFRQRSLVVLPNPGTPFASCLAPEELVSLAATAARSRSLLLVDESYLPFVPGGKSVAGLSPSLLTVFSWSKALGTPGIPVGHSTGDPRVLEGVRSHLLPWTVGPLSYHLALLALRGDAWVRRSLERVISQEGEVRARLGSRSRANYFVLESPSAHRLRAALLERGYLVRDLSSMGLPRHVRFGVRRPAETRRFLRVLDGLKDSFPLTAW